MNPFSAVGEIVGGLFGIGKAALENYQHRQTVRAENEAAIAKAETEAKIRWIDKAQEGELAWDIEANKQMAMSWKDEWFTILLSVPLILAFMGPWGAGVVGAGFAVLATMPDWYMGAVLTAIAASFGVRALMNFVKINKR